MEKIWEISSTSSVSILAVHITHFYSTNEPKKTFRVHFWLRLFNWLLCVFILTWRNLLFIDFLGWKTNLESFLSFLLLTLSSPSFSSSSNISSSSSILGTFLYSSACFRSSYKYQLFKMYFNFKWKRFQLQLKKTTVLLRVPCPIHNRTLETVIW